MREGKGCLGHVMAGLFAVIAFVAVSVTMIAQKPAVVDHASGKTLIVSAKMSH